MPPLGNIPFGDAAFGDDLAGGPGPQPGAPEGLALRIGPTTDALRYLFYRSWRIHAQVNGRNTCRFTLLAADGFCPERGQPVSLTLTQQGVTTIVFAGSVYARRVRFLSEGRNDWTTLDVECVDHNALADRRKIAEVYEHQTLGAIVRDIVSQTLAAEGVTPTGVEEGPVLAKVVLPNLSVAQAFDQLSAATGYYWTIDYFKALQFFQRQTSLAPFAVVNGANAIFRRFTEEQSLAQYRNSEFLDGGKGLTATRRETFRADGTGRTFTAEYPLAEAPQLDLNGVPLPPEAIGVRGSDEPKQYYWAKGSNQIGHDQGQPVLAAGTIVGVTYIGLYDLAVEIIDPAKVAERQAVEGGSGLYEHVQVEDSLDGADVVTAKALALLSRYGLSSEIEFETDQPGLDIGQQVSITIPELGIHGALYLITELEIQSLVLSTRHFRVRASTGELKGTFTEFWKRIFARNPITIRDDAVVQTVTPLFDAANVAELVTATLTDYADRGWGDSEAGVDEWETV